MIYILTKEPEEIENKHEYKDRHDTQCCVECYDKHDMEEAHNEGVQAVYASAVKVEDKDLRKVIINELTKESNITPEFMASRITKAITDYLKSKL